MGKKSVLLVSPDFLSERDRVLSEKKYRERIQQQVPNGKDLCIEFIYLSQGTRNGECSKREIHAMIFIDVHDQKQQNCFISKVSKLKQDSPPKIFYSFNHFLEEAS